MSGVVEMTSSEWEATNRMGDYYWLYVVKNEATKSLITSIQNAAKKFRSIVRSIPTIDYRYVIEEWKPP